MSLSEIESEFEDVIAGSSLLGLPMLAMLTGLMVLLGGSGWAVTGAIMFAVAVCSILILGLIVFWTFDGEAASPAIIFGLAISIPVFLAVTGHDWIFTYPLLAKTTATILGSGVAVFVAHVMIGPQNLRPIGCRLVGHKFRPHSEILEHCDRCWQWRDRPTS